ncbi:MAG: iron ABC transporter permease [Chloroflexi bacterium]|nr:iron ABC transporter permease [Chloroflexota bacterium]
MVLVPALLVGAAVLLPLVYLLIRTFGAGEEALDLLLRQRTLWVTLRTLGLAAVVTVASAMVALPLAWLTVRTDLPFRRGWAVLTALPLVIPSYVGALAIVSALGPRGMLQQFLEGPFGVDRLPDLYGFPGAAIALTLFTYPYMLLSLRTALWRLDPALEEASRSLGAGPWSTFLRVVVPHLRPALGVGGLLVALYTLSDFGAVSLLRFESLTQQIYVQYQASFSRHLASVFSLVLAVLTISLLVAEGGARGRARYHRPAGGSARPAATVRLGRWRWPALIYSGTVTTLALVLPVAVLGYWAVRGVAAGEPLRLLWGAAWNSIYISGLAAVAAALAALPVAILAVRHPGRMASLIERSTYMGFALPGIVVALALVFFGANYATALYQTVAMLLFAYVVLFLPQAVGTVRTSLLQVSPRLEEVGRSLGRSPVWVWLTVTIPLVRPGLVAGAALVFLTAMKELPATLLLSPIGFQTLATRIWGATADGFFARAASPALLLILVSSVPLVWLLRRERGVA